MRERLIYIFKVLWGEKMKGAQKQLVEILSIKQSTISGWLSGNQRRKPGRDAVDKLHSILNIDSNYLLHGGIYRSLCRRIDTLIKNQKMKPNDFVEKTQINYKQLIDVLEYKTNPPIQMIEEIYQRYSINRFYLIGGPHTDGITLYSARDNTIDYENFERELRSWKKESRLLNNENKNEITDHERLIKIEDQMNKCMNEICELKELLSIKKSNSNNANTPAPQ